ncbi:Calx-beta domain-containing protein, partial [Dapis sp. BLCC M229]|uniref:Calx-beta domain-containing protein n=1 Tax=Dapis sp. BLCC M229 TaxID=3400188 RepID=UPI003CEF83E9
MNLLTANQNDNILCQNSASNGFLVSRRSPGLGMLVVIDPRVENYGMLASGVLPGAKVVILESGEDGVRQVSRAIADRRVSSLHIVCHGSPGSLQLGNTRLSLGNLAAYGEELERWGEGIGSGGILLYGCEVAAGDIGAAFVERLHELSGVGVAAAVGRIGCAELGASWELGVKVGNVGDGLAFGEEVLVNYGEVFADITVNSTDDPLIINVGDGLVTLREAIAAANNDTTTDLGETGSGADTIIFDPAVFGTPQTITIIPFPPLAIPPSTTTPRPFSVTDDLTIEGTGAANLTISGDNTSRVFNISNATVTISDVTISNGSATNGGGIYAYSGTTVTINNSTISGNSATSNGGGIYSEGSITLDNSTISGNTAYRGAGVFNHLYGYLAVTNSSTITGNVTTGGNGGGITNLGDSNNPSTVTINNSTISNNQGGDGGGIYNTYGILTITNNSNVSDNNASSGGGIYTRNNTTVTVSNSNISNNNASNDGGSIYNGGNTTIDSSTISNNSATEYGGGVFNTNNLVVNSSTISGNITTGTSVGSGGGAIHGNFLATLTLNNSTIYGNTSNFWGGGINQVGGITEINNSTISGNIASNNGGGINNANDPDSTNTLTINNSTIAFNTAGNSGGGVYNQDVNVNVNNSIIAGNQDNFNPDVFGGFNSNNSNLIGETTGSTGFNGSEVLSVSIDSVLDTTLQNNGGLTQTHALIPTTTNPAIDSGNNGDVPPGDFDQRGTGFPRIIDGDGDGTATVDIGAFEITLPAISIDDVTVSEADGTATFTLSLDQTSSQDIAVDYITTDNTATTPEDYTGISNTTTIVAGQTTASITVDITDDTIDELDETFNIDLSNPVNATIADDQGIGTIVDNDQPSVTIADVTVDEDAGTATFTLTLDQPGAEDIISVDYTTTDQTATVPDDYTATSGTVSFASGIETTATITVDIIDDTIDEIDETFLVSLSNPTNLSIADPEATATITDNDQPSITIDDITVDESGGTATFALTLDQVSSQDITLDYNTTDDTAINPDDYTAISDSLTITAGETTATVTVDIVDDNLVEDAETFNLNLSNAVNATISDNQATATITDNDQPSITIDD